MRTLRSGKASDFGWLPSVLALALTLGVGAGCAGSNGASRVKSAGSPSVAEVSDDGSVAGSSAESVTSAHSASRTTVDVTPPEASPLPSGTVVLHIGDSFAESLGAPLGRRFVSAGLRNVLHTKTPSYTPGWAYRPELKRYIARYNPDLVLVTLGGNEFEIPNPDERIPAVERIVQTIGARPCIWITPPRWKQDTGILRVIREHAAPCHVLDSDSIVSDLPRAHDHVHPSEAGRERWADAVLDWLEHARDPAGPSPWALRN